MSARVGFVLISRSIANDNLDDKGLPCLSADEGAAAFRFIDVCADLYVAGLHLSGSAAVRKVVGAEIRALRAWRRWSD